MEGAPNDRAFGKHQRPAEGRAAGTYSGATGQKKSPDLSGLLET